MDIGDLKLSAQRALLGNVTPNLRAVCVDIEDNVISAIFFCDKEISEEDFELYEQAKDQIIADFCQPQASFDQPEFSLETVRLDYPEKMPLKGFWVYYRNES